MLILVTGGLGFIGSNLVRNLLNKSSVKKIVIVDSMLRHGSIINYQNFYKNKKIIIIKDKFSSSISLINNFKFDFIIDCASEPSVQLNKKRNEVFIFENNLRTSLEVMELAKKYNSKVIFLSSSRVYNLSSINNFKYICPKDKFILKGRIKNIINGEIQEGFSTESPSSFYGMLKKASESLIIEYCRSYNLKSIINRCGLISGHGQFGRKDQGIIAYWLASQNLNKSLSYIGFGGLGHQVRDALHINDLINLILLQIDKMESLPNNYSIYNISGGKKNSFSLKELNKLTSKFTRYKKKIKSQNQTSLSDVKYMVLNSNKAKKDFKWKIERNLNDIIHDTNNWVKANLNFFEKNI